MTFRHERQHFIQFLREKPEDSDKLSAKRFEKYVKGQQQAAIGGFLTSSAALLYSSHFREPDAAIFISAAAMGGIVCLEMRRRAKWQLYADYPWEVEAREAQDGTHLPDLFEVTANRIQQPRPAVFTLPPIRL